MHRIAALLLFALPSAAIAVEPWSGDVGAGYLRTTGNTADRTANGKFELVFKSESWKNTLYGSAVQTATSGLVTTERYTGGDQLDWNFTENDYAFLSVDYEKDLFGPVRERTTEAIGYGRHLLQGPAHILDAEIGAGAQQSQDQLLREREDDVIGRARIAYRWNFAENSHFGETVKVTSGELNTFTESVTELGLAIAGNLYASAAYTVRNNSDVPAGSKRTDTITTVSLNWSFGKE